MNKDGEVVETEDFGETPSVASVPTKNINVVTHQTIASYKESREQYAKRCKRNGMCPHDGENCKHYKSCVLKKAETCMNFAASKTQGRDMITCSVCVNRPVSNHYWRCNMFECMVAYKGRK